MYSVCSKCIIDPSPMTCVWLLQLAARLPARVQGYPWRLAYSTVVHGTSLKTLYRNLGELDCPVLLVIKDMNDQVYIHTHIHTQIILDMPLLYEIQHDWAIIPCNWDWLCYSDIFLNDFIGRFLEFSPLTLSELVSTIMALGRPSSTLSALKLRSEYNPSNGCR